MDNNEEYIIDFIRDLANNSKLLDIEFAQILDENFDELWK